MTLICYNLVFLWRTLFCLSYLCLNKPLFREFSQVVDPDNNDVIFAHCSEVVKQELQTLYEMRKVKAAVTIQCWVRRWICYKRWPSLKRSLELQKKARHGNKVNHKWVVYRLSSILSLRPKCEGCTSRSWQYEPSQVSFRSWKTWKVMEFMIWTSRPGMSRNSSERHGKSWKAICFQKIKRRKDKKNWKNTRTSRNLVPSVGRVETDFNFSRN